MANHTKEMRSMHTKLLAIEEKHTEEMKTMEINHSNQMTTMGANHEKEMSSFQGNHNKVIKDMEVDQIFVQNRLLAME